MSSRRLELAEFGPEVIPLNSTDAASAYDRASLLCSRTHYGLDETSLSEIERLDVNGQGTDAQQWLAERIGTQEVLMMFGRGEVFRVPAMLFVDRWRDMLCPSRDDAVVTPSSGEWVLFYSHEDEFEFARM